MSGFLILKATRRWVNAEISSFNKVVILNLGYWSTLGLLQISFLKASSKVKNTKTGQKQPNL